MKKIILLLALIIVSCTNPESKKPEIPKVEKYMTIGQIEKQLDEMNFNAHEELLSEEARSRIENLPKSADMINGLEGRVSEDTQPMTDAYMSSSIDNREFDQPIVNQWNGTCTAHATAAMMETLSSMKYKRPVNLSERDLWSRYKKYSAQAAIDAALENFIVPEKYWPHDLEKPKYNKHTKYGYAKISKSYYLGEDYKRLFFRMSQGETGKIAMAVPYSMANCDAVINPSSDPIEGAGHDIAISGILVGQKYGLIAIIKNSWGEKCGDHGYQYLPLSICDNESYYCYFWSAYELEYSK